jgi:spermidine/putrescine transport system substrate-binding protein
VPLDWGISTIIYRPDLVSDPEQSYALLWDNTYAGRLAIDEDSSITMIVAGLVAGVSDPFDMSNDELGRVKALLEQQKPLLRFYWSDDTVLEEAFASGEVVASTSWLGPYARLKERGVPIEILKPREGTLAWCCGLVLTKTASDLNAAHELIDYLLGTEAGAWLLNYGAGHSNPKSYRYVDRALLAKHGLDGDPAQTLSESIMLRYARRMADYQKLFDEVAES